MDKKPRERRRRGILAFFLAPVFYWFDLYGADGLPSHTKVLSAIGFFASLGAEIWWGFDLSKPDAAGITWPYVWLVVMTLAIPMGKDVWKAALGAGRFIGHSGNAPSDHRRTQDSEAL